MIEKPTEFVPNGESRVETAILLVGTAREFGIDQHSITVVPHGFLITEELAEKVYAEDEPEPEQAPTKKTSGNRAAKNATDKE